jgi:hypothetical protein
MNYMHFIAVSLPTNTGYSWTLVTRMGQMLHEIEALHGARDMSWTLLGVEFGPDTPQIWYPGNRKNIAIQLAMNAIENPVIACYQLAHECVHLLAPDGGSGAPVLEEGLATVFSEDYVAEEFQCVGLTNLPSYIDAATKVRQLLDFNRDAIKMLRKIEPCFKKMTATTFEEAGLNSVPKELVNELLAPFNRE